MTKLLVYGDSFATRVQNSLQNMNNEIHVESYPGATSEALKDAEFGLSFLLGEDSYTAVIIIAGNNDVNLTTSETISNINDMVHQCGLIPCFFLSDQKRFNHKKIGATFIQVRTNNSHYNNDTDHLNSCGRMKWIETVAYILDLAKNR